MFNSLYNIMPCTVLEYLIVSSTLSLSRGEERKRKNAILDKPLGARHNPYRKNDCRLKEIVVFLTNLHLK